MTDVPCPPHPRPVRLPSVPTHARAQASTPAAQPAVQLGGTAVQAGPAGSGGEAADEGAGNRLSAAASVPLAAPTAPAPPARGDPGAVAAAAAAAPTKERESPDSRPIDEVGRGVFIGRGVTCARWRALTALIPPLVLAPPIPLPPKPMPAPEEASGPEASGADLEAPPAPAGDAGRSGADCQQLTAAVGAAPEATLAAAGPAATPREAAEAGPWDEVRWGGGVGAGPGAA
jgi:hypothetical protein